MNFGKAFVASLLLSPIAAHAAPAAGPAGYFDVFYAAKSSFELDDPSSGNLQSDGGSGFGVRGRVSLVPTLFLQGEYQANSYDGFNGFSVDTDLDLLRFGVGTQFGDNPFYGVIELVKLKIEIPAASFDESESGYGLHVGAQGSPSPALNLYAQVGYLDVGDAGDGIEWMLGGVASLNPSVGLFADYRHSQLQDDSNAEATVGDFRVGLRVNFGV